MILRAIGVLLALLLGGCIGGSATKSGPMIAPLSLVSAPGVPAGDSIDRQLVVALPASVAVYDSERVVARTAAGELSLLAGVRWPDTAPQLLQDAVVTQLQSSGRLRAVTRRGSGLRGDLLLSLQLLRFEADYSAGASANARTEVAVLATLIDVASGRALGSRRFATQHDAERRDAAAAAAAVLVALDALSASLANWVLPLSQPAAPSERSD